jgi:glycerol-3-phosphate dehydrogenase (NAD(P)+)
MKFGIIGSGSWGTALAKILTDNGQKIAWWNRSETAIEQFLKRGHNPQYLSAAKFDTSSLQLTTDVQWVVNESDVILLAVPAAYVVDALNNLPQSAFAGKKILSAIKGILPEENMLLNDYLYNKFGVSLQDYFAVMGPCHAEEIAAEKLSYLTFSGLAESKTEEIATYFKTAYLRTVVNLDIIGVQYAAVLKNIYALGAGIAHGLDYGDNFLSVLIANSSDEMAVFLRKAGILNAEVGYGVSKKSKQQKPHQNYSDSVYLGDLLVTCYSLYSRNRTFGNMIGKGYSVKTAMLEMNMVAEGYNASKCMHIINQQIGAEMPIANTVYEILWNQISAEASFAALEAALV